MDYLDDDREAPKSMLPELFKLVDKNKEDLICSLKEPVSIPSVSNDPDHHEDIVKMLKLCTQKLRELGARVQVIEGHDETSPNLPQVLYASLHVETIYKTICIYGNVDTASPDREGHPFELNQRGDRLYGCGVSDNKAPLFCWINAIELYKKSKNKLPVNIKFIIEGSSENYSKSLLNTIHKNLKFFQDVEYMCLTIDKRRDKRPCLKYGYRGFCHFSLMVQCGDKRVHGGTFGGAFNQPLLDATHIVGSLMDKHGKVVIPEFLRDIKEITMDDYQLCNKGKSVVKSMRNQAGVKALTHKEKPTRVLMHKTRLPSLTVNAFHIKGVPADIQDLSSIPNKIEARFSVRLVPNQTVSKAHEQFQNFVDELWDDSKSTNRYEFKLRVGFNPWLEDPSTEHYQAAEEAIKTVYKVKPDYICEGTSMPVVSILSAALSGTSIIVMPISGADDCHHSACESISVDNYLNGIKLAMAYMCEIHELNFK